MADKTLKQLREELLADPGVREANEEQTPEYAIAREIIAARVAAGLSQAELAERMETSQPFIARLESGRRRPSMRTPLRVADATGTKPEFRLKPKAAPSRAANSSLIRKEQTHGGERTCEERPGEFA